MKHPMCLCLTTFWAEEKRVFQIFSLPIRPFVSYMEFFKTTFLYSVLDRCPNADIIHSPVFSFNLAQIQCRKQLQKKGLLCSLPLATFGTRHPAKHFCLCVLLQDNFIMFTITHECPSKGATQFYSLAAQLIMEQLVNLGVPGIQRLLTDI